MIRRPAIPPPRFMLYSRPMTSPLSFLWRMVAFLVAVALVCLLLGAELARAFAANPALNGLILAVLGLGIAWNMRQVLLLRPEVAWLEAFQKPRDGAPAALTPRLLAPMANMFASRKSERFSLSAPAMRGVLDGISSRLDETREISRYATNLLIFLGLLGTFWGLILTIGSVAGVIGEMNLGSGDANAMFDQLKSGLAQPLAGMGVAFSSSMLGLAGALVLGFLDLTAGQAQNRFFNELEEWLAGLTRLSSGVLGGEGEAGAMPAYVQALLEQTAENLESLQSTMARGEESRGATSQALTTLAERMAVLTEQMRATQILMQRVAEQGDGRDQLGRIEQLLARILEDATQGRAHATAELRGEIKLLSRTLANRPG